MIKLTLPLSDETIKTLKAGDYVLLSGFMYTGRDAAHKLMVDTLNKDEVLPINLKNAAMYYVGATPAKPGLPIGSCGPTSSYRMDPFAKVLMNQGLKVMIGKGERSHEFVKELVNHQAIYFIVTGGIGALLSQTVLSSTPILYHYLGTEAVHIIEVVDFPCIVAYDSYGSDIYQINQKSAKSGQ